MTWRCDISSLKDVPILKSKATCDLMFVLLFTTNLTNIQMQYFLQEFNILLLELIYKWLVW